jgi:hypothetical protein
LIYFLIIAAPTTPLNLRITETLTSSIKLAWDTPPFTGEKLHFILNINGRHNLTMSSGTDFLEPIQLTIDGLEPGSNNEFKILAYNSVGQSSFSQVVSEKTLPAYLDEANLPTVKVAAFDDVQESICFEIEATELNFTTGLVVQLNIVSASEYLLFHGQFKKMNSNPIQFKIEDSKRNERTCISYLQIVSIEQEQQKMARISLNQTSMFDLFSVKRTTATSIIGDNFHRFKSLNKINVSICFAAMTSVCSDQVTVADPNSKLLAAYITSVIVVAAFLLVILIILLISKCVCSIKRLIKLKKVDAKFRRNPVYGI